MEEEKEIDISSEVVRDYMDEVPHSSIRWGSGIVSVILLICFFLTWLIKYPTIVMCEFSLTTHVAPKPVVARADARLEKLLVSNHQRVETSQILGFLESSAFHGEVLQLEKDLEKIAKRLTSDDFDGLDTVTRVAYEHLGEVQSAYQSFRQQLAQINSLLGKKFYQQKRDLLQHDIAELKATNYHLQGQYDLYVRDATLAEKEFAMNKKLFDEKVISPLDFNREESKLVAKKIPIKNIEASQLSNNAAIRSREKEIIDLDRQVGEQKESFRQSVYTLRSAIALWKNRYVLVAPEKGEVLFSNNLQEKQNVRLNTELFQVFENSSAYVGLLTIPQVNSGKIKVGQRVLVKFQGYPFEEFGVVEGIVSSSPQLSVQNNTSFFAFVEMPNGLQTNHHKQLSYNYGMVASAEVVTEDLRLMERIFYSIRRIFQ